MGSKLLQVNIDKSTYLLAAKRKNLNRICNELLKDPLTYKNMPLTEKLTDKWLGSIINPSGVKESTVSTINERKGRINTIINETIAIIEDCRLNKIGATQSAKDIFQLAILPALLNNGELFFIHDPKIQKSLEEFQYKLWRGVLAIPKSCPLPAMLYESESWLLKYRVYSKIVNLVKHIHCHDESSNL